LGLGQGGSDNPGLSDSGIGETRDGGRTEKGPTPVSRMCSLSEMTRDLTVCLACVKTWAKTQGLRGTLTAWAESIKD